MELTPLKDEVKLPAIRVPAVLPLPEDLVGRFTRDEWKVFGHFCNKNPELDCMSDPTFLRNVAKCIKATANGKLDDVIRDPLKMTSHPLYKKWSAYYQDIKDKKALERKDPKVKARTKARNECLKSKYGFCTVDGVQEPLQSYALEPEGIFPGRPGSPDAGLWKEATDIAEVVVNAKTFSPKLLVGDDDTEHIYSWTLSFNPENHYAARYPVRVGVPGEKPTSVQWKKIMFSAKASCKKEGQQKKYDASEVLIDNIVPLMDKIVRDCEENPTATSIALYLLFTKGIRIGNAKPTKNGTKGLLTLEWGKDVKPTGHGFGIKFDFLGKDSVHDLSEIELPNQLMYNNFTTLWADQKKLKTTKEEIKKYVTSLIPGVPYTPKLSRTVVAANTMIQALDEVVRKYKLTKDSDEGLKKLAFNEANMEVAKRLNHQRGVNKTAEAKRKAKFEENKNKLKDREAKAKELEAKRKARIKELEKKGGKEEAIAKIQDQIAKSKSRVKLAKMNESFKEENQNFVSTTSKSAYICPRIIKSFCDRVSLPIEKVYTKTQVDQFSEFFD